MERIWIYQANRPLSDSETKTLETKLSDFADRWSAHGKKLTASYEIHYNRFIVLKVENGFDEASGCSIDDSVRFLRELEKEYNLSLFDRSQMAYLQDNEVKTCTLGEISSLYGDKVLKDDTVIFDNTVTTGDDYKSRWQKPLKESGYFGFVR
jgi:hypothetical protein